MENVTHTLRKLNKREKKAFDEAVKLYESFTTLIASYENNDRYDADELTLLTCSAIVKRYNVATFIIETFYINNTTA